MLGLKRGTVKLIPHQKEWHDEFIKERNFLHSILGANIYIEHIGSTAIPDLPAKPIIDIIIGITPDIQPEPIFKILSEIGYEDRGDEGISGRQLFVKNNESKRTHHLHIIEKDSVLWSNYIFFRDYLRQHKTVLEEYKKLKQKLANKFPNDREAYTNGKDDFIKKILKQV